jgi:hypothetical protein
MGMTPDTTWENIALDDRIAVDWVDTTNMAAWLTPDELVEFATDGGWACTNTGWVSYIDDDCVVVSARRSGTGHWGLSERIPRQAVTAIQCCAEG